MNTPLNSEQILLYYLYVHIPNPKEIAAWQRELCTQLGLKGRIIIAHEGINGTVGGRIADTDAYIQAMHNHPLFAGIDFKTSAGGAHHFPKLSIKIKDEIVALGIAPDELTPARGGTHLTPEQTHALLNEKPKDLVIIDCRNDYESAIGRFENAVQPDTKNFREFPAYIDRTLDELKDKQVLMYCTGGVRCERASAYLKEKGVETVYQIEGGIHRYVEAYPDGHFRGKLYVFDDRIAVPVNNDVLGSCIRCAQPCDEFTNCAFTLCNAQCILCDTCLEAYASTCSQHCQESIIAMPDKRRASWRSARYSQATQQHTKQS